MSSSNPLRVGIIGCGSVSNAYLRNSQPFKDAKIVACADIVPEAAARRAGEYGIRAMAIDALLADPEVDLVLNLTVPAAHFDITHAALSAGKHVFTEKPLATSFADGRRLVEEARARDVWLGSAPDTFLGAAGRLARRLLDEGAIGKPVAGTAFMFGRGMEHWHPAPQFYYQPGAGPMLDMGPYYITMLVTLLGPVKSVSAIATTGEARRLITAEGPNKGTTFPVETPTTVFTLLTFHSGPVVTFGASWDVFRHSNSPIELHGTEGSLRLPDPDTFGGTVGVSRVGADWVDTPTEAVLFGAINYPFATPRKANYRFLGVADFARALREGRPEPRTVATRALHVLEVMEAALASAETHREIAITTTTERPLPFSEAEAADFVRTA